MNLSYINLKKLNKKQRKNLIIVIVILFLSILTIGILKTSSNENDRVFIPEEFINARIEAGEISQEITDLSVDSKKNLDAISEADRIGDYYDGLELVKIEINRNTEIRIAAVDLAEKLKIMAVNIPDIESEKASDIALRTVTNGMELVQHLVNYNNYTYDLLSIIQNRLGGGDEDKTRKKIEEILINMNKEVEFVNELNEEYKNLALEFDKITYSKSN